MSLIRTTLERGADWLMSQAPVASIARGRVDLVTLAYHGVDDRQQFAAHLDHLVRAYTVVGIENVLSAIEGGSLPKRAALITFDDGHRSVLTNGLPELEKRGLPSVLFDVPGVLDSDTPFWWVEVETLVRNGANVEKSDSATVRGPAELVWYMKQLPDAERIRLLAQLRIDMDPVRTQQLTSAELLHMERSDMRIENHSMTHPLLNQCTDERVAEEIDLAHNRLAGLLGREPTVFAFPNGDLDERVVRALAERGYRAAFLFDHRIGEFPPLDPLRISRVRVNSTTSTNRFISIVSGVHPAFHRARGGQ